MNLGDCFFLSLNLNFKLQYIQSYLNWIIFAFVIPLMPQFRARFDNFVQLVRDDAYAVGCAMARFKDHGEFVTLFTCNYSVSVSEDQPIYKEHEKSASGCKKGTNKHYDGLCSIKEVYNNRIYYRK